MKTISIIGVGNVGGTLGRLWAEKGHEIRYGLRNEQNPKFLVLKEDFPFKVHGRMVKELRDYSEIIVLAVPYTTVKDLVSILGDLDGKIVVDTTNPILPDLNGLSIGHNSSAAEENQKLFPKAKVVKAFNYIGMGVLKDLDFGGITADAFICGDDNAAKNEVASLAKDIGFNSVDVGGLAQARYLEPLAMLWITLVYKHGFNPDMAFKLLQR